MLAVIGLVALLDLSQGVLSQSNCKTAVGCAHHTVAVTTTSFTSSQTASSLAQHILTLALRDGIRGTGKGGGPHALELEYELVNPSGQGNTLICASALDAGAPVRRCAGGLKRSGRLTLPLSSGHADAVFLHFAAMPLSTGSSFAVRNVRLVRASAKPAEHPQGGRVPLDLATGRLRQPSCQVPVGCAHPSVTLTSDVFASVIAAGQPPPPSDNPNAPPKPAGRLSLELPVPDLAGGPRVLEFDYAIDAPAGRPAGRIRAWVLAGGHIVETVVDKAGAGRGSVALPPGSPRVDQVTIAVEPVPGGAGRVEVSGVGFGRGHPAAAGPLGDEPVTCEMCDPPASRLDPCGELLVTFYVEAADAREGRGVRCVSPDLTSWHGEGWWNDQDGGRYRHLGYFVERSPLGLPSIGVAIDFGHRRTVETEGAERLVEYGAHGIQTVAVEVLDASRLRVFTLRGTWNEIWTHVPKGTLLPHLYGSLTWDGRCGANGLVAWQEDPRDGVHNDQVRCAIPDDFDIRSDPAHAARPLAWYGAGYLEQRRSSDIADHVARPHLGWQTAPAAEPSVMFYSAADRCVLEHENGCHAYDEIRINVLAADAPGWEMWGDRGPGLNVFGPGTWQGVNCGTPPGGGGLVCGEPFGFRWARRPGLPPDTALPPPTPVCLDAGDCP